LSPSIFRKTKGPLIAGTNLSSGTTSTSSDTTARSIPSGGKKVDLAAGTKEFNLADFDLNQCLDWSDVHCKNYDLNFS
jgi:hypothetical protein